MKPIMGKCPYTDLQTEIAYLLETEADILALIRHEAGKAGIDHLSDEYILENRLIEIGERPIEFPCIAVVDADDVRYVLRVTYVIHTMFEV